MAGTYWLTVLPDTSKLMPELKKTLTGVEVKPKLDPKEATKSGNAFGRRFGQAAEKSTSSALAGIGAKLGGALLSGQAIRKVLTTGNELTTTLNTLQGVSGATADVMAQVSDRARELGADVTLPATSAAKAAAAMTELAKGGLSVDQAMEAAKGTLALAAAAGTDAAQAAEIQANALNTFGQNASFASKAADILAATANASSVEINDVALGLQQGGTVAAQFGIDMKDTAAAIGVLGNAGIKGSDAGTLLKSALLALANPSKKAQGALDEMGVTAFDSQGNFVGLSKIFQQLQDASKKLTPEMYAQDAAMAFGSDAARLAGVAAREGAAGFDAMVASVDKNGAALDVANANMQGLPGAWEKLQNSLEELALTVYDLIKGPLQSLVGVLTNVFGFLGEHQGVVKVVAAGIGAMAGAMLVYKGAVIAVEAPTKLWAAAQLLLNAAMDANPIGLVVVGVAALAAGIIYAYKHSETFRNVLNTIWEAIKTGVKIAGDAMSWLWHTIFVPAWDGIKSAVTNGWNILEGIFNTAKSVVSTVGDAFSTAFNVVKTAVQDAWNVVGGIIDKISSGIGKVGDALAHIPGLGFLGGHAQGGLVGAATGGLLRGPGTGTSDSIVMLGSHGEFVVNAKSTRKHLALIQAINADALPGFAEGGLVDPYAYNTVASLVGTPYKMGGFGPGGIDCSGLVSGVVNTYLGLPTFDSRMATPSEGAWLRARGAKPGRGGFGDLTVLWWDGGTGGGVNGHTMAVLPNGDTIEAGGSHGNVAMGAATTSPNDGQWQNAMHFPQEVLLAAKNPQLPGSGGGSGSGLFGPAGGGGGGVGGGSGGGGGGGGSYQVDPKRVRDAEQRVADAEKRVAVAEQRQRELKATAKESQVMSARDAVERAKREADDARRDLAEAKRGKFVPGKAGGGGKSAGGGDDIGSTIGKTFMSGIMETLGVNGDLFSNPMDWPNVKSGMALLNVAGGMIKNSQSQGSDGASLPMAADAGGGGGSGMDGLFGSLTKLGHGGGAGYTPEHPGSTLAPGRFNPSAPGATAPSFSAPKAGGDQGGVVNDNRTIFNGNVDGDVSRAMSEQHNARVRRTRTTKVGG